MRKLFYLLVFITINAFPQDSLFVDCNGTPSPENWVGDGYCDDGSYSWNGNLIFFDCEEFNYDGGDCEAPLEEGVYGCTDPEAVNYNPLAEIDNGGCANVACDDGEAKMLFEITLDQYPSETGWILTDISNGQPIASVTAVEYSYEQSNTTIPYQFCVPETGVELILSDTYGDGIAGSLWGGTDGNFVILADLEPCGSPDVIWELPDPNFGSAAYSGPIWIEHCDIPIVYGCTDNSYLEFNPSAQVDDGSCENLHTLGCLNWTSFNYNPEATLNEIIPTCDYTLTIGDAAADGWGESYLVVTQEDSIVGIYTMGPGYYYQEFSIQLETDKAVNVYYFEVGGLQQPQAEVEFQTMHNSFELINADDIITLQGGVFPFSNNGNGALQPFEPPFWHVYSAMPYCGDYCIPSVYGCLIEESLNYNPEANTSDDSCIEIIEGCTSPFAFNYDDIANTDDGSCVSVIVGCMDNLAWNYNVDANTADESCLYFGCTDELALNYDSTANVNNDNCIYPIPGCTDPFAFNFEVDANVNDGSCIPVVIGCMDPSMYNYNEQANTESDNCIPFIFGCTDPTAFNYDPVANTDNESCIPVTPGCTDPNAFNYNAEANTEDFSCIDIVYGCTDSTSFNYDPLANTDNESCIDVLEGCMDPLAFNYDAIYNTDDGSCLYDAGCVGDPGDPFWLNDTCYAWVIMVDPYCCNNEWDIKCQELYWSCSEDSDLNTEELLENNAIIIYPNPTENILNISSRENVKVNLFDLLGNLILSTTESKINISQLSNGTYILNIEYRGEVINKKIIKQ